MTRRRLLLGAGGVGLGLAFWQLGHGMSLAQLVEEISELKPGQFTWHPERSPDGPVAIIVSLPDQLVHVYRNGIRIAVSTCSTGKPGHETPTGVFTILQKDRNHHSSTYNEAPMPNMNRLTWSGVALHAGQLPGYPASHGCVRLPLEFSKLLFTVTHVGTAVIIANAHSQPNQVTHPGLVLSQYAEHEFDDAEAALQDKKLPSPDAVDAKATSVIVSSADQSIIILENGETVAQGKAFIKDPAQPLGSHVFILTGLHDGSQGLAWHAIGFTNASNASLAPSDEAVIRRVSGDPSVIEPMKQRMHQGLVLVLTDLPAQPDTRTGKDFVILNQADS
ncbi:MAG: L,D-transpeptidase [Hyphomicrobiales bacterium]